MTTVRCFDTSNTLWNEAVADFDHDIFHLPSYVDLCARQEQSRGVAVLAESGDVRVFVPLILKPIPNGDGVRSISMFDAISPYGYPAPLVSGPIDSEHLPSALEAVLAELRNQQVVSLFVRSHPLLPFPCEAVGQVGAMVEHGDTVSIDLTSSLEDLWSQTRSNTRNKISRAQRSGLEVVYEDSAQSLEEFHDLYTATMTRLQAASFYFFDRTYFSDLKGALGKSLHLFTARLGDQTAGAALFTECNGIVQYFLSATNASLRSCHSTNLLLHHAKVWAKERGNRSLHLGGGTGAQNDSLFHFKAGFSSTRHSFYTWRAVVDAGRYDSICAAFDISNDPSEGYFPAYRDPQLKVPERPVAVGW